MSRRLPFLVAVCALASCVHASRPGTTPSLAGACFRFDQAYFTAVGRGSPRGIVNFRSDVIRLLADSSPPFAPGQRVPMLGIVPVPFALDSFTVNRWLSVSGWYAIAPDSLGIEWRNGLYGPVFRLQPRGDSLVGTMIETTDFITPDTARRPKRMPARAKRVDCPSG